MGTKRRIFLRNDTSEASIVSGQESEYDIFIDLTESMLYLFKGNELIKKYAVAQGKEKALLRLEYGRSHPKPGIGGTGFGTRWMGINVPWGSMVSPWNQQAIFHWAKGICRCFRMHNSDVEELYDIVPYKTKVYVYGGPYKNLGSHLEVLSPGGTENPHVLEVQPQTKGQRLL